MCGIVGFLSEDQRVAAELLPNATDALAHRGPDGASSWVSDCRSIGLGHTRLAVIDLVTGDQPMFSNDGRYGIVFNGEIYNYRQVRQELIDAGATFHTSSDTEVLLNAYRHWGQGALLRVRGMFAFAVADVTERSLFLARDRVGIKPLYFYAGREGFIFASELKAILQFPIPRKLNYKSLIDFLVLGYPLSPATFFDGCFELEPGTCVAVNSAGIQKKRYWHWKRQENARSNDRELEREAEEVLLRTVRDHLIADVPIGAFLSGGVDSSLLVALLAQREGTRLSTFNASFGEPSYDEAADARLVASENGTAHQEVKLPTNSPDVDLVDTVLDQFDQPFGDSSAIPTYLVCREMRKAFKVAIGGDGGDEMFGGYPRFRYADLVSLGAMIPRSLRRALGWFAKSAFNADTVRQTGKLLRAADAKGGQRLLYLSSYVAFDEVLDSVTPAVARVAIDYEIPFGLSNGNGPSAGDGASFMDTTIEQVLPSDYLRKIDVASSAHGLEVRVPYLGDDVLDFSARIPSRLKFNLRHEKVLLKRLAIKHLPERVVNKRKQGFGIPLDSWLGAEGRDRLTLTLLSPKAKIRDLMTSAYVSSLTDAFTSQQWDLRRLSRFSVYQRVYCLYALERWLNKWQPSL